METRASVTLDKKAYPFMMHLSIVPKYEIPDEIADESFSYDPRTQTSNIGSDFVGSYAAMSGSWSEHNTSSTTKTLFLSDYD